MKQKYFCELLSRLDKLNHCLAQTLISVNSEGIYLYPLVKSLQMSFTFIWSSEIWDDMKCEGRFLHRVHPPSHSLFTLLPSDNTYRSICCCASRLQSSFTPPAATPELILNNAPWQYVWLDCYLLVCVVFVFSVCSLCVYLLYFLYTLLYYMI